MTAPVAIINNQSLRISEWGRVANWLSYTDADGNPAVRYEFYDAGTAANSGYFWTPTNDHHPANTSIVVDAADLASVWIRGGTVAASETMWVRAFDGAEWSTWDAFTFTTI